MKRKPLIAPTYLLLSLWLVSSLLPVVWTFLTSIKDPSIDFAMPPVWSFTPTLEAYDALWVRGQFPHYLLSSAIISLVTVAVSIPIGSLAGYALSRFSGAAGFVLLTMALVFRTFPRIVFVIPFCYISRLLGLYDTRLMVALAMISINQPFTIWLLRGFFLEIPKSMEESAMVDGCSRLVAFVRIVVPIVRPGMITAAIFSLFLSYNVTC